MSKIIRLNDETLEELEKLREIQERAYQKVTGTKPKLKDNDLILAALNNQIGFIEDITGEKRK